MKKRIVALLLSVLLVFSACALVACNLGDNTKDTTEKQAYVSLDINPAVELIVDRDNIVVSVRGENEDGQVLLYEEAGILGEKIDVAVRKITDLAIQYGYLDESNKVVDTLVSSGDSAFAAEILNQVNTSLTVTAEKLGLRITTDGEGAYSLLRQMDEVKKQFPENRAVQEMSVAKFKLALSVSRTGGLSIEAAIALDDEELIKMLKEASLKIEEFATEAYLEAKEKALAVYDRAVALASYSVYSQFYFERMLSHPLTAYYGGVYQMYASAAMGFRILCDVADITLDIRRYPLNEAQIQAVVTALGMESADALKNANGEITVESIEAYADKLFKNTQASDELEKTKAALTKALTQAESVMKEEINDLTDEYKPQIEAALQNTRQIMATVEAMTSALPESMKTALNNATADLKDILSEIDAILIDDEIRLDVLKEKADRLEVKANEYLDKIKADLSEEEWAELESRKAAVVDKMTEQKKTLEKALDDAEKAAKEYLENLKKERKPAQ